MKKHLFYLLLALFATQRFAEEIPQQNEYVIVLPFINGNVKNEVANAMTDKLISEMESTGKYIIIDKGKISEALKKKGFQKTACTNEECIAKMGKLLNIKTVFIGRLKNNDGLVTLSIKQINIENGQIATIQEAFCKPCTIAELYDKNITKLVEKIRRESRYKNGRPQSQYFVKANAQGKYKIEGLATAWYEFGRKKYERNYKDGVLEGLSTTWYKNGHKKDAYNFVKGIKSGAATTWYENGKKESEAVNKNGKKEGVCTFYYKSGQKLKDVWYVAGKKEGLSAWYYKKGQKQCEITYKNGKTEGISPWWSVHGKKIMEKTYRDGKLIHEVTWDEKGNVVK
jgi:antitoxin component YwqK of YwqJK toxin-antitoxin module